MNCPICNAELENIQQSSFMRVMDGNIVKQCPDHKEHRFWINPRDHEHIHLNPNASVTDFKYERRWKLEKIVTFKFTEDTNEHT